MSDLTLVDALARVATALNDADIPYMVINGQAVIHYGEPRFTRDIDLTVGIAPDELPRVLPLLLKTGFRPNVDDAQQFVDQTHVLPLLDEAGRLRADVSFTDSSYEVQAIARGTDVPVKDVLVRFVSVEDLLIHKLIAGRPIDLVDVKTVLLKNPDVDLADIRHWLSQFAEALDLPLLERLDRSLSDTGLA